MALADLVGALGWGGFVAGSAVFFTRSVGLSPAQVGAGLSAAGAAGFAVAVPGGRLIDRLGPRRVIVAAALASIALFVSYAFVHGFWSFLPVVLLLGAASRLDRLAIGALVGGLLDRDDRVSVSAYLRSVNNAGFAVGSGLAGLAVAIDTRPAYLALPLGCAATTALMVAIRSRLPDVPPAPPALHRQSRWLALRDRPFVALTVLFGVARLDSALLDVAVPLWILHHTAAPRPLVAWLVIVNTLLVIGFQVRAARGSQTAAGIVRAQRLASLAMMASCLVFGSAGSTGRAAAIVLLVLGMALLTLGELWISAAAWSVRYGLAAQHAQGQYGAVFSMGGSAVEMAGPAIAVLLTDRLGLAGWGAIAGVYALLLLVVGPLVRRAGDRPGLAG